MPMRHLGRGSMFPDYEELKRDAPSLPRLPPCQCDRHNCSHTYCGPRFNWVNNIIIQNALLLPLKYDEFKGQKDDIILKVKL